MLPTTITLCTIYTVDCTLYTVHLISYITIYTIHGIHYEYTDIKAMYSVYSELYDSNTRY